MRRFTWKDLLSKTWIGDETFVFGEDHDREVAGLREKLRAVYEHCQYVENVSPVARAVLKLIGDVP